MKRMFLKIIVLAMVFGNSIFLVPADNIKQYTLSVNDIVDFEKKLDENEVYYKRLTGFDIDNENHLYYLEGDYARIFKVDTDSRKLLKTISSKGQGPGELVYPFALRVKNGKIFVFDYGFGGIKIFDLEGKCLNEFKCAASTSIINWDPNLHATIDINCSSEIYLRSVDDEHNTLISVYDLEGNLLRRLITSNIDRKNMKQLILDAEFAFKLDNEDNLIVLYLKKGQLKKYDKEGHLTWERDLYQDLPKTDKNKEKFELINTKNRFQFTISLDFAGLCLNDNNDIFISAVKGGFFYDKTGKLLIMLKQPENKGFGTMLIWDNNRIITPEKNFLLEKITKLKNQSGGSNVNH